MEKVLEALNREGDFSVLADEHNGVVRLWTLSFPFCDGRSMGSLKSFFPNLSVSGKIIKLGGYRSLVEAQKELANAKVYSRSKKVKRLFRFDTPESSKTLKSFS